MGKRGFSNLIQKLGFYAATYFVSAITASAACSADAVSVRGEFGSVRFDVTVADEPEERAQGLMFVEQMDTLEGMLFVFERPQRVSFWMRNTLIPLDMIFVGPDGVIDHVHSMAVPLDETPIFGGTDIQYVLEINGGMAERLGLAAGNELQHPSVSGEVVWPCLVN